MSLAAQVRGLLSWTSPAVLHQALHCWHHYHRVLYLQARALKIASCVLTCMARPLQEYQMPYTITAFDFDVTELYIETLCIICGGFTICRHWG